MSARFITPESIYPPFGQYAHGVLVPPGASLLFTTGQLGISKDGAIPESVIEQSRLCFDNISAILDSAGMQLNDIVQLRAFVTSPVDFQHYMQVRDEYLQGRAVASTLMAVSGFSKPAFKVEVEAIAAKLL